VHPSSKWKKGMHSAISSTYYSVTSNQENLGFSRFPPTSNLGTVADSYRMIRSQKSRRPGNHEVLLYCNNSTVLLRCAVLQICTYCSTAPCCTWHKKHRQKKFDWPYPPTQQFDSSNPPLVHLTGHTQVSWAVGFELSSASLEQ